MVFLQEILNACYLFYLFTATDSRMLELLEAILLQVNKNWKVLGRLLANQERGRVEEDDAVSLDMIPLSDYDQALDLDRQLGEDAVVKNALVGVHAVTMNVVVMYWFHFYCATLN